MHRRRVGGKRVQTNGLEAIGRSQTIELLPGVSSIHVAAGRHEGRVRSGLGGGALDGEVADRVLVAGVQPDAEGVNHGNRSSRELVGERGRSGLSRGSGVARPVVGRRVAGETTGRCRGRSRNDVAVVRGGDTGKEGKKGVELDGGGGDGSSEVDLHRQHAAGGLRDRRRANDSVVGIGTVASCGRSRGRDRSIGHVVSVDLDSVVGIGTVASCGRSRGRDRSIGHVVSVDLDSVDVGDHSELVLELHINSSNAVHAREGLAEKLRSRGSLGGRSESDSRPVVVTEAGILPVSRGRIRVLPGSTVTDGGVQRELDLFQPLLNHHALVHHVAVNTVEFNISQVTPSIISRILHSQRVDGVGGGSQTGLDSTDLVVGERRGSIKGSVVVTDLERLLISPTTRLLDDLQVILVGVAIQRECKRNDGWKRVKQAIQ